ncbi:hypothetical protein NUH87_05105 [Pseudomonas batumici]|uniref:hypothetical protein n=1 Tax=Pseudomonas batumici TaxID=226910 RepID=UPI0030D215A1
MADVDRLLPGVTLPVISAEKRAAWNMSIDNPEETRYRKTDEFINMLEELRTYVNKNSLRVVIDPESAEKTFDLLYAVSYSSDYHKAGASVARDLYLEAARKGYPLMINTVRERLNLIISEYASLTYSSLLTLTGTLLR